MNAWDLEVILSGLDDARQAVTPPPPYADAPLVEAGKVPAFFDAIEPVLSFGRTWGGVGSNAPDYYYEVAFDRAAETACLAADTRVATPEVIGVWVVGLFFDDFDAQDAGQVRVASAIESILKKRRLDPGVRLEQVRAALAELLVR